MVGVGVGVAVGVGVPVVVGVADGVAVDVGVASADGVPYACGTSGRYARGEDSSAARAETTGTDLGEPGQASTRIRGRSKNRCRRILSSFTSFTFVLHRWT
jgi:hypothetical protein